MWVGLIAGGETLYLSVDRRVIDGFATVDIMVAEFCTDHNILDIDVVAVTTGTATADDAVGVKLIDHSLST